MTWIVTADGNELSLRKLRAEHITIEAIAHALAQINRFNGHAKRPYSVAEHSLLVAEIAAREPHLDEQGQLAALMHDAHEAFCGDLPTPMKAEIPGWSSWEASWKYSVREAFGLPLSGAIWEQVHRADLIALATERRDLMPQTATPWPQLEGVQPVQWYWLSSEAAQPWSYWRQKFLQRHGRLAGGRDGLMGAPRIPMVCVPHRIADCLACKAKAARDGPGTSKPHGPVSERLMRLFYGPAQAQQKDHAANDLLHSLMLVACGATQHRYEGGCPDETDPTRRDRDCPACRVLLRADALPDAEGEE